ncbi:MAG: autotransporter outer membrane beta-barrel domain-containing protein [Alphaproteobacteria bacterium]|nr:autotransporter outer membrane beta-barrel domain-containing protein [Alphaproteobacteria bacterium]
MKIRSIFLNSISFIALTFTGNAFAEALPGDCSSGSCAPVAGTYEIDNATAPVAGSLTINPGVSISYQRDAVGFGITGNLIINGDGTSGQGSFLLEGTSTAMETVFVGGDIEVNGGDLRSIPQVPTSTSLYGAQIAEFGVETNGSFTIKDNISTGSTVTFSGSSFRIKNDSPTASSFIMENGTLLVEKGTAPEGSRAAFVMEENSTGSFEIQNGTATFEDAIVSRLSGGNMVIGEDLGDDEDPFLASNQPVVNLTRSNFSLEGATGDIHVKKGALTLTGSVMSTSSTNTSTSNITFENAILSMNQNSNLIAASSNTGNMTFTNTHIEMGIGDTADASIIQQVGKGNISFTGGYRNGDSFSLILEGRTSFSLNNASQGTYSLTVDDASLKDLASIENNGLGATTLSNIKLTGGASIEHNNDATFTLTNGSFTDTASLTIGIGGATNATLGAEVGELLSFSDQTSITFSSEGILTLSGGTISLGTDAAPEDEKMTVLLRHAATSALTIDGADTVVNLGLIDLQYTDDAEASAFNFDLKAGTMNLINYTTLTTNSLTVDDFTINGDFTLDLQGITAFNGTLTASGMSLTIPDDPSNIAFGATSHVVLKNLTISNSYDGIHDLTVGSTLNLGENILTLNDLTLSNAATINLYLPNTATDTNGDVVADYGRINANSITVGTSSEDRVTVNLTVQEWMYFKQDGTTFKFIGTTDALDASQFNLVNNRYEFEAVTCTDGNGLCYIARYSTDGADATESMGGDEEQVAIAGAFLDGRPFDSSAEIFPVADALNELSQSTDATEQATYLKLLSLVGPEKEGLERQTAITSNNMVLQTISNRFGNPTFHVYSGGMNSGDNFFNSGFWVQTLYNRTKKIDESDTLKDGYEGKNIGGAMGLDAQLFDSMMVGFGYSYTSSSIDNSDKTREIDIKNNSAFVYAKYQPNNFYVNLIGTYSTGENEMHQTMTVGTTSLTELDVKSTYDTKSYSGQVMFGYETDIITPSIGARYFKITQEAYTDAIGQEFGETSSDFATAIAELSYASTFEFSRRAHFSTALKVGGTYDVKTSKGETVVSLPNGNIYTVEGKELDRAAATAGASITFEIDGNAEIELSYDYEKRKNYQSETGSVKAKLYF